MIKEVWERREGGNTFLISVPRAPEMPEKAALCPKVMLRICCWAFTEDWRITNNNNNNKYVRVTDLHSIVSCHTWCGVWKKKEEWERQTQRRRKRREEETQPTLSDHLSVQTPLKNKAKWNNAYYGKRKRITTRSLQMQKKRDTRDIQRILKKEFPSLLW